MAVAVDKDGLRVPPHSDQAEQALLGGLLLDNAMFATVADLLQVDSFYRHEHRLVWGAIATLIMSSKPADVVTVWEALDARNAEVPLAYVNDLAQCVPSGRNARAYAQIVARHALSRRVIAQCDETASAAYAAGDAVDELLAAHINRMVDLQQGARDDEPRALAELLAPWVDALGERAEGRTDAIATGLHDLDRLLAGGVRRGEVMVIGARPSMGKSALMLTVARQVSRDHVVLVCSMEDSDQMLVARQVAAAGRVNLADIRQPVNRPGEFWEGVSDGVDSLRGLRLWVDDRPALTLADVRRKATQVRARAGDLALVVLDYLQLMDGDGETRSQELADLARGLKRLAKELRCAVLLLSQLNREADKLEGPPRLDHLAESGGIEQAADIIGLLWREARRKPTPTNKHDAQVEIVKQKNGPTDTVRLWFDGATQRFADAVQEGY